MFSVIVMKLNLTTGIIPSLNVSAGLLGFFFVRLWTSAIERMGFLRQPFTRQENTVIQTCVVAAYDIAFSGGFGNYLFAMSGTIASQATEANDAQNVKDPHIGWMIGFLFLVSFVGLFALVPLRKIMIVDYKLTYPSGTATAYLINGFHTPEGAKLAKKQVRTLGKFFSFSFLWGFFQWFYTAGDGCGFQNFPTLGLQAYKSRFYFDFSPTYVGVGMICPHIVNVSVLLGGILSWGVMWPLIHNNRGSWYSADLKDSSLHGLQGYRVFISIAMILGDGLYNFVKVLVRTSVAFAAMVKKNSTIPVHVHQPDHRHRHGLRHRALRLLALLQGLRRHRHQRHRVPRALRHRLPQHGHTRRRRLLLAPQALPHALLRLLRRRHHHQPRQGLGAGQGRQVHPAAHGHGHTVLHRLLLRHRHVRRHRHRLRVGDREQGQGRRVCARGRLGADLRRRHLDAAAVHPRPCKGEAADLHEVSIEIRQCQRGCLPRKLISREAVLLSSLKKKESIPVYSLKLHVLYSIIIIL
ncbi:unnamed protein product [Triticum turgidum subsp. durum]|uniref:Metal-nicotianamine transporter YSL7 n=1 Tax=Triticum turgidum subsp. durum TaxID=4567 RepID=A0A9R1PU98_TRITD|nr:unnamed protein product [Triticum turgidum subsp. durum]